MEDLGSIPKKTTPYHPPANGTVERFNQSLKRMILAAYIENKDPVEEVDKLVFAYRNTPLTVTGLNPTKLAFNREVKTKLPRFTKASRGQHHKQVREKNWEAKIEMQRRYDMIHQTREVPLKLGDWTYVRQNATTTTKGTWDPKPYQVTNIYYNRITGTWDDDEKIRDRSDWKLLVARPLHLQAYKPRTRGSQIPTTNLGIYGRLVRR